MRYRSGVAVLAPLLAALPGAASASGAGKQPSPPSLLRIEVSADREDLDLFAPLLEGRLAERLGKKDGGGFAVAKADDEASGAWRLRCVVKDLRYDVQVERNQSGGADSSGPVTENVLFGDLELALTLARPGEGEKVLDDSVSLSARRVVVDAHDVELQRGHVVDDLLERASDRIDRLLRKKIRP